jgi:hypothetical protein
MIRRLALHVALPLATGAAVYLLVRPAPHLAQDLRAALGLGARLRPGAFVRDVLPDAAWAYALTATPLLVWSRGPAAARWAWTAVAAALAVGWELAQIPHLVRGSFSLADLAASVLASALAVLLLARVPSPKVTSSCPSARSTSATS